MCTHPHTHTHAYACIHAHTLTRTHTCTHMRTHTYTQTHRHTERERERVTLATVLRNKHNLLSLSSEDQKMAFVSPLTSLPRHAPFSLGIHIFLPSTGCAAHLKHPSSLQGCYICGNTVQPMRHYTSIGNFSLWFKSPSTNKIT